MIVGGPGNVAAGHCTLVFASLPGRCTFSGGTGIFTHFQASVAVSVDAAGLWHWEGTYSFRPQGDLGRRLRSRRPDEREERRP